METSTFCVKVACESTDPSIHAIMHPMGSSQLMPVAEWIDARPSDMKIANEFASDRVVPTGSIEPCVPDDTAPLPKLSDLANNTRRN